MYRERDFDCVITTSPPESAHGVGMALARRGVPWVADVRDAWNFEHGWADVVPPLGFGQFLGFFDHTESNGTFVREDLGHDHAARVVAQAFDKAARCVV